jgi:hypothetical protein
MIFYILSSISVKKAKRWQLNYQTILSAFFVPLEGIGIWLSTLMHICHYITFGTFNFQITRLL